MSELRATDPDHWKLDIEAVDRFRHALFRLNGREYMRPAEAEANDRTLRSSARALLSVLVEGRYV